MAPDVEAAGMKRKRAESSSSSPSGINHEVFLNFRGKDTRKEFTDVLYKKLKNAGIKVFKDDKSLRAGEKISWALKDAIKRSRISIAIFSKNYASSKYCLMELVEMWECRESGGQTILPIFYDVSPYAVKNQAEDFKTSFDKHEVDEEVDSNTIQQWRKVLREVGELSGFDPAIINGGHVSDLQEEVLKRVMEVLKEDDQDGTDKLVGIDLHVQEIMTKLGVVYSHGQGVVYSHGQGVVYSHGQAIEVCGGDVRVIGITGMSGVGKTALAKVVFNKIHKLFDRCSFLKGINSKEVEDSRELLIADLQNEKYDPRIPSGRGNKKIKCLFENMKVLIVLDDVREVGQIEALVGKLAWFGPGSRIIVTTKNRNVLEVFDEGAFEIYKVEPMSHHHALELFRKRVFQGDAPQDVFECDSLSPDIVEALGRLPMAIELQARYLKKNMNLQSWRSSLKSLKNNSLQESVIQRAFEASYESLDNCAKEIFLDIACFFIGEDERIPPYMWEEVWDGDPLRKIKELRDMHFLEDGENNELRMHNLLRDFGRKLVKDKDLHERCRIWNHSDALSILEDGQPNARVKGISLPLGEAGTVGFTFEALGKKSNLRYVRLHGADVKGNPENLLPNLRWLDWRECHFIPKLCNMDLKKLLILDLSWSPVTKCSQVWRQIMEKVNELKVLNLQGCDKLHVSLDFQAPVNLEILILEDCTQLSQIGTFIRGLENLSSFNLRNCRRVKKLPPELAQMKSLKELLIDGTGIETIHIQKDSLQKLEKLSACGCEKLKDISPIGHLTKLESLALDGAINWHPGNPEPFEFPQNLRRLSLRNCERLLEVPPSMGNLRLLEVMDLSYTGIIELPGSVKDLRYLKTLKMEHTHLQKFPEDIAKLEKLEEIDFSGCRSLGGQVTCDISGLSSLRILRLSSSNVAGLPQGICGHSRLQILDVLQCNQLQALPELPSSLVSLRWGSRNMAVPDLSYLTNLKELCLKDYKQPEAGSSGQTPNVEWITRLQSLETLQLSVSKVTNLPGNFSALTQLRELSLSYMKELDLTQLPSSSLLTLRLKHCKIPEPTFSSLQHHLSELKLKYCELAEIDGLEDLNRLVVLIILYCKGVTNLNGLKDLPRLRKVKGIFEDRPSLPKLSKRVKQDIYAAA
ncbi:hypothetical protein ACJRO7_015352 [Eucalyptus globulus]|uniref:TIR domain-containing protein n=1 Tax=Eucalyptus globulus TaxID=34317 RepID=A0ABD3L3A3_EUCGL